jgi:hypothetical protein
LSPESATRTLLRPVTAADLHPAYLRGFRRTWTAAAEVFVNSDTAPKLYTALFLDLSTAPDVTCNGVLLDVEDDEWERLDLRERMYERAAVQVELGGKLTSAFTYVVPDDEKINKGIILEGYLNILRQALHAYPDAFKQEFWSSTTKPSQALVSGHYVFRDKDQNQAAGRG